MTNTNWRLLKDKNKMKTYTKIDSSDQVPSKSGSNICKPMHPSGAVHRKELEVCIKL